MLGCPLREGALDRYQGLVAGSRGGGRTAPRL
jgi:hypothetical protein